VELSRQLLEDLNVSTSGDAMLKVQNLFPQKQISSLSDTHC
jgi:hypothetical protein